MLSSPGTKASCVPFVVRCAYFCIILLVIFHSLGNRLRQPEKDWECDLEAMEALIDSKTRAILVNNPSNPCGSNYSEEHLRNIVEVARRHNLPIIADEIYCGLVYDGVFVPIQTVCGEVPILSVGGNE